MMRQIYAAEITLNDVPVALRERFEGTEQQIKKYLSQLRQFTDEVYILHTRGRFTIYGVSNDLKPLTSFLYEQHHLRGYVQLYYNTGESVAHLFALAAGLLSTVKGDTRVLDEVDRCYGWAKDAGTLGPLLDHTIQKAMETGRRVRTRTGIDQYGISLVDTGIELLYSRLENLHQKNIVVVGTGTMACAVLEALTREGFRHIALTGEASGQVQELAGRYSVLPFALSSLPEYLSKADIIIGADDRTLDFAWASEAAPLQRDDRFVLDLGVPPNFDEALLEPHCTEVYNLDDLRRLQPSPLEALGGIEDAWRRVVGASNEYVHLLELLHHAPILTAYLARQFYQRSGADNRVRNKRSLRKLLFGRSTRADDTPLQQHAAARHLNNCAADDALEVVREVQGFNKFRYYLPEN